MRSLSALSNLLGEKPYVMGNKATAVDAICFGMLAGLLTPFFNSGHAPARAPDPKSLRLCRAHDGGVLSGIRLGGGGVIPSRMRGRLSFARTVVGLDMAFEFVFGEEHGLGFHRHEQRRLIGVMRRRSSSVAEPN